MSASAASRPIQFDPALEGLRGLACLLVLTAHLLVEGIDPHLRIGNFMSDNVLIPREAVLIFFLISGYVIGLINRHEYSPAARRSYLWKRFLRLVPLYWLAIVLSVWVNPIDSWKTVLAQFFFLQNTEPFFGVRLSVLKANFNLWSLNYEIIYYATFLVVWRLRLGSAGIGRLIFTLIAVSFFGWMAPHFPKILSGYAAGGAFWYTGLWLVWYAPSLVDRTARRLPWITIMLLLVLTPHLGALNVFMRSIGFRWPTDPDFPFVSLRELQVLPVGLIILAGATARRVPMPRFVWTLAFLQPVGMVVAYALTRQFAALREDGFSITLLALAVGALPLRFSEKWLTWLCPVGLISYGIYIFARPVQYFFFFHFAAFSGAWWTFSIRVVLAAGLTFLLGYTMERLVQPRVRSWLRARFEKKIVHIPVVLGPAD